MARRAGASSVLTDDVTVISAAHGRERRAERGILKSELQAAVKHGLKEPANPGRQGDRRWRYTHQGVVYITDESGRHEITSWRLNDNSINLAVAGADAGGCHAVLVVDHSGSMRKADVEGYDTRTAAVYDCLARDFVEAQIAAGAGPDVVVSVIEMSDDASVIIDKAPLDGELAAALVRLKSSRARSHGNYLPALDKALEILQADTPNRGTLMLLFLSDGAPSDHNERACEHGVVVWKQDVACARLGLLHRSGKPLLLNCRHGGNQCRMNVRNAVASECMQKVIQIGDLLGRDRLVVGTVAFGDAQQDYSVLKSMGEALPRGSFHRLGLNAAGLRTAFSSMSSTLTTLRADDGSRALTLRNVELRSRRAGADDAADELVHALKDWLIYNGDAKRRRDGFVEKCAWSLANRQLENKPFTDGATGLAFYKYPFAQGVERLVYRCSEVTIPREREAEWYPRGNFGHAKARRGALQLVMKEAKHTENLGRRFQEDLARVQAEAAEAARVFNRRANGTAEQQLTFLDVDVYMAHDETYPNGEAWVLVERELEGKFRKWNNNNGVVFAHPSARPGASDGARGGARGGGAAAQHTASALGAICEEEEDEEEVVTELMGLLEPGRAMSSSSESVTAEVPQAFSHFSYDYSAGKTLICDLQGVWNATDGYVLTDPVIHYVSSRGGRRHRNGATDKGAHGVLNFFKTHKCGALCRRLGLTVPNLDGLAETARVEARMCVICMSNPRATRFGPCRHASCCEVCADELLRRSTGTGRPPRCPICRDPIRVIVERGQQVALQMTLD